MLEAIYLDVARKLKALSEPKRLKIVDMLSCGEICACEILAYFNITQPTLSHDMKVLLDAGIVASRREGKNTYYRLREEKVTDLVQTLQQIFRKKENCICTQLDTDEGGCCDEK